ncbi:MAG: B12-binding domain-containing radical SAM protein [Desulfobulbaceae bacterium]|nr:B12-binding domain-containing radical SAM protein [Desulfobulbaceae bacterium]
MKVLLILPNGRIHLIRCGSFRKSMREAPLTMPLLAALAPPELEIEFELIDESIDNVPDKTGANLVAISAITGTATRAYELAEHFRKQGIPVVLGGVHVSLLPDEAQRHADSIVIGTAENTWPQLLRDFAEGRLKKRYTESQKEQPSELILPPPRNDLLRRSGYMVADTVMATRGCPHVCDFCTIPALGVGYVKRPIADVIRDIKAAPSRYIAINDVSLVDDVEYAFELFRAMVPLKKRWGGLATTKLVESPQLVEVMAESGCNYLLFGFESFAPNALGEIHKSFNHQDKYRELMELLHEHNISVQGCFIFGFDHDDKTIFQSTVEQINELQIDIPRFSILTPYPGTGLYRTLSAENRIISYKWEDYDTMHVVFQPELMTPGELYAGFKWAYRETFKMSHVIRRTMGWKFSSLINLLGNMNYRKFSRRLENEPFYACPHTNSGGSLRSEIYQEK